MSVSIMKNIKPGELIYCSCGCNYVGYALNNWNTSVTILRFEKGKWFMTELAHYYSQRQMSYCEKIEDLL